MICVIWCVVLSLFDLYLFCYSVIDFIFLALWNTHTKQTTSKHTLRALLRDSICTQHAKLSATTARKFKIHSTYSNQHSTKRHRFYVECCFEGVARNCWSLLVACECSKSSLMFYISLNAEFNSMLNDIQIISDSDDFEEIWALTRN